MATSGLDAQTNGREAARFIPANGMLAGAPGSDDAPPVGVASGMVARSRTSRCDPSGWDCHSSPVGCIVCAMILPQVHLRKPCYDFSFL